MKVAAVTAGEFYTLVWTEEGEFFTFGGGYYGQLGHGGSQPELVPRLVKALTGKKVAGAAAGISHTAVWTDRLRAWRPGEAGPRRGRE